MGTSERTDAASLSVTPGPGGEWRSEVEVEVEVVVRASKKSERARKQKRENADDADERQRGLRQSDPDAFRASDAFSVPLDAKKRSHTCLRKHQKDQRGRKTRWRGERKRGTNIEHASVARNV